VKPLQKPRPHASLAPFRIAAYQGVVRPVNVNFPTRCFCPLVQDIIMMMHWFYYVARYLTVLFLFIFTRFRIIGRDNIPAHGPLLVTVNHIHLADPPVVGVSINRKAVFMAKEQLFRHWPLRFIVKNYGAFPVRRGHGRESLRQAEEWLARDFALIIFPEGKRSRTFQLQSAFTGPALIATRLNAPILPVGISGTEKLSRPVWWLRRPSITVSIGQPFSLPPANGRPSKKELNQFTDLIMSRIAALLPPEYRGEYGAKS